MKVFSLSEASGTKTVHSIAMNKRITLILLTVAPICYGAQEPHDLQGAAGPDFYHPLINLPLPSAILAIIFKLLRKKATQQTTIIITENGFATLPAHHLPCPSPCVVGIIGTNAHGHEHAIFSHPSDWPENHTFTTRTLSQQLVKSEELTMLAGTPYITFLVPSLAELLITGKLTVDFYKKNKKLVEEDIVEEDYDSGPPVYEADLCKIL
jgi:hypothetical protein